jgi:hypothetical protein
MARTSFNDYYPHYLCRTLRRLERCVSDSLVGAGTGVEATFPRKRRNIRPKRRTILESLARGLSNNCCGQPAPIPKHSGSLKTN